MFSREFQNQEYRHFQEEIENLAVENDKLRKHEEVLSAYNMKMNAEIADLKRGMALTEEYMHLVEVLQERTFKTRQEISILPGFGMRLFYAGLCSFATKNPSYRALGQTQMVPGMDVGSCGTDSSA